MNGMAKATPSTQSSLLRRMGVKKGLDVLGIVTARLGSKRIPFKNVQLIGGKPMTEHTINSAMISNLSRILVSTDSEDILGWVNSCWRTGHGERILGCRRPSWLATDRTPHLPVLQHAVEFAEEHYDYKPEAIMILQPTSPFRSAQDINQAINLYSGRPLVSINSETNERNAAIYIMPTSFIFDDCPDFKNLENVDVYSMPVERSLDINTLEDLAEANRLMS